MSNRTPILNFIHNQKAAGMTLRTMISCQYAPGSVIDVPGEHFDPAYLATFREMDLRAVRAIQGHMPWGLHAILGRDVDYITVLREPVDRILSLFFFKQSRLRLNGGELPPDAVRHLAPAIVPWLDGRSIETDNGQTRFLSGEHPPYGECSPDMLARAETNLRQQMAVVGLAERFDESALLLQRHFNWPNCFHVLTNATPGQLDYASVPAEVRALIAERNQFDIALYEAACTRFAEQIAAAGPAFAEDVERFRTLNRAFARLAERSADNERAPSASPEALRLEAAADAWQRESLIAQLDRRRRLGEKAAQKRQRASETKVQRLDERIHALVDESKRQQKTIAAAHARHEKVEARKQALEAEVTRLTAVEHECRRVSAKAQVRIEQIEALEAERRRLAQVERQQTARISAFETRISALEERREKEIAQQLARIEALEAARRLSIGTEREHARSIKTLEAARARLVDRDQKLTTRIEMLTADRARAQLRDQRHTIRFSDLEAAHARVSALLEERDTQAEALRAEKQALESVTAALVQRVEELENALQQRVAELETALQQRVAELETARLQHTQERDALQQRIDALEASQERDRAQLAALKRQQESLQTTLAGRTAKLAQISQRLESLREEHARLNRSLAVRMRNRIMQNRVASAARQVVKRIRGSGPDPGREPVGD